jgi:hypothetical protein
MTVVVDRVPPGFDATHLGFVVIDEMGSGHCGAPMREIVSQAGLTAHEHAAGSRGAHLKSSRCAPTARAMRGAIGTRDNTRRSMSRELLCLPTA